MGLPDKGKGRRPRDRHRDHRRPRPPRAPGRQAIPSWLTILIGLAAVIIGTLIANALDVGSTRGVDWIELFIQIAWPRSASPWSPAGTPPAGGASDTGPLDPT
jgi:hypothetical protein